MICFKCGMQLPDDSEFCQYCGSKIAKAEVPINRSSTVASTMQFGDATSTLEIANRTSRAQEKESAPKKNPAHSKPYKPSKWLVAAVVCLSILVLASVGLNVYQYLVGKNYASNIVGLSETISDLNSSMEETDSQIDDKDSEISNLTNKVSTLQEKVSSLQDKISSLEDDSENYNTIVNAAKYDDLGYAASNFQSSESVIVVREYEQNRKFTLTAYWSNGGDVTIEYDSIYPAAYVDFDLNSWSTSTNLTITPNHTGVTVVTFSNSVNSQTFDVIIIVE